MGDVTGSDSSAGSAVAVAVAVAVAAAGAVTVPARVLLAAASASSLCGVVQIGWDGYSKITGGEMKVGVDMGDGYEVWCGVV